MRLIVNTSKLILQQDNKVDIILPESVIIKEFEIINANIPYSFYNITFENCQFNVQGVIYTLETKQYNIIQLVNTINSLISSTTIIMSFDRQSSKVILTNATSFTFNPLLLGTILGFDNNALYTGLVISGIKNVDITNNVRNIYIKSNIAQNNIVENSAVGNGILYRIPINVKFGEIIYYINDNPNLFTTINQTVKVIQFELTDSNQNRINFNGLSFQLEFYIKTTDDEQFKKQLVQREDVYVSNKSSKHPIDYLFK